LAQGTHCRWCQWVPSGANLAKNWLKPDLTQLANAS
jgi:hypothetical protein